MTSPVSRPWYQRIGPGLITACVVIGPGSILTSSKVGAANGFSMLWVVVVAVFFMMMFMTLGARLGVQGAKPPGDLIRDGAGGWLAVLVGISVFFISAAFQSGNNIGLASAFEGYIEDSPAVIAGIVIVFNALAISFLFAFKNVYRALERLMMCFVALMLIAFLVNLVALQPDMGAMATGFVPSFGEIDLNVLALVGTTFVITAAYYQAYLVRQKGWGPDELKEGQLDARIGSIIMALITIMLMSTAAAGLFGKSGISLSKPHEVAIALEPGFGAAGRAIFCIGIFCAAYSSFLVNSMIGGFILSDCLRLGSSPEDKWPRVLTSLVLLTGMGVGLAVILFDFDRTPTIIAAQAVTVIAAPLVAGVLFWLTSRKTTMGEKKNGPFMLGAAGLGLLLLLAMAYRTAFVSIPEKWSKWTAAATAVETKK